MHTVRNGSEPSGLRLGVLRNLVIEPFNLFCSREAFYSIVPCRSAHQWHCLHNAYSHGRRVRTAIAQNDEAITTFGAPKLAARRGSVQSNVPGLRDALWRVA